MLGYLDPETAAKRKTCKFNNWQVWPKLRSYCWQGSKWGAWLHRIEWGLHALDENLQLAKSQFCRQEKIEKSVQKTYPKKRFHKSSSFHKLFAWELAGGSGQKRCHHTLWGVSA
jgi:hypothetical protein